MASSVTASDHLQQLLAQVESALSNICLAVVQCDCLPFLPLPLGKSRSRSRSKSRTRSKRMDPSPSLEAQEGELDTLLSLDGNQDQQGWDDEGIDDFQDDEGTGQTDPFSRSKSRKTNARSPITTQLRSSRIMAGGASSATAESDNGQPIHHLHRDTSARPKHASSLPEDHPSVTHPAVELNPDLDLGLDDDPRSLASLDTRTLADIAKRFEPTLTMEDIEREEAEQAEMERLAESAGRLDVTNPSLKVRSGMEVKQEEAEGEEFGEFESGNDSIGGSGDAAGVTGI
ncbi:hypothetical protein IAU59_005858 [Kwoniella sp. CBS 9459]